MSTDNQHPEDQQPTPEAPKKKRTRKPKPEAMPANGRAIVIRNIGPIDHCEIDCPEAGGLIVLYGRNGSGKTHALNAIDALSRGDGKLPVRDGCTHGTVEGPGAGVSIHRNTRHRGKLEFDVLGGRLSPADLVDPGLKDPGAADAARIKALCHLTGAKPDPALFVRLAQSQAEFDQVVSQSALESPDVLTMAARIKADFEKAARSAKDIAERARAAAAACREQAADVDRTVETDPAKLQATLEQAIGSKAALEQQTKDADQLTADAAEAKKELLAAITDDMATVEAATEAEAKAHEAYQAAVEHSGDLARDALEVEHRHRDAQEMQRAAGTAHATARKRYDETRDFAESIRDQIKEAERKLASLREQLTPADEAHQQAETALATALNAVGKCNMHAGTAASELRDAQETARTATATAMSAKAAWEAAQQLTKAAARIAETKASAEKRINAAAAAVRPTTEAMEQAAAAITTAREAIEAGALARQAIQAMARAESLDVDGDEAEAREKELRDAAHGTDDVLSEIVARSTPALRVEAGRLVTTTSRGPTFYAELSDGERWRIALDLSIDAICEGGLLTIPQPAWEGLDPPNRDTIHAHLIERKTVAVTAEAADCELTAKVYGA